MATQRTATVKAAVKPIEFETGIWNEKPFLKIHGNHKPIFITAAMAVSILDCIDQVQELATAKATPTVAPRNVAPVAAPVARNGKRGTAPVVTAPAAAPMTLAQVQAALDALAAAK